MKITETMLTGMGAGDNNLSFIETSALDASNVELAFQNILTGIKYLVWLDEPITYRFTNLDPEIYRIVSSKALDNGESSQNPLGERKVLEISKSTDTETKSGKCC